MKIKRKESKGAKTQRAATPSIISDGVAALCVFAPLLSLRFNHLKAYGLCQKLRSIYQNKINVLLFLLIIPLMGRAEPFGKDADLVRAPCRKVKVRPNHSIHEKLIQFHQDVISPADGPRSHFFPSSSQYTLEAMRKHGFYKGFLMGCDRLQRENNQDWVYRKGVDGRGVEIKLDPVR